MKLLVDMNLSPRWIPFLTNQGLDAVHWSSLGEATASDTQIMEFAAQRGFVVVTHDLDFSAILAATQGRKPSVVQIRMDDIGLQSAGPRVTAALKQTESELQQGALLTVEQHRTRIRSLPIRRDPAHAST